MQLYRMHLLLIRKYYCKLRKILIKHLTASAQLSLAFMFLHPVPVNFILIIPNSDF